MTEEEFIALPEGTKVIITGRTPKNDYSYVGWNPNMSGNIDKEGVITDAVYKTLGGLIARTVYVEDGFNQNYDGYFYHAIGCELVINNKEDTEIIL